MKCLPDVPGPKLAPFNAKGKQPHIDFIECIGNGLHSLVWKVRIDGKLYALNIFNFYRQNPPNHVIEETLLSDAEEYSYFQAIPNECRVYGRLKEFGQEHLAVRSYGYILLHKSQENFLEHHYNKDGPPSRFDIIFETGHRPKGIHGKCIPAIVKELVDISQEVDPGQYMVPAHIPKLYKNLKTLHHLGIYVRDLEHWGNVFGDRYLDFSQAWTAPHPALTKQCIENAPYFPGLNYHPSSDEWDLEQLKVKIKKEFESSTGLGKARWEREGCRAMRLKAGKEVIARFEAVGKGKRKKGTGQFEISRDGLGRNQLEEVLISCLVGSERMRRAGELGGEILQEGAWELFMAIAISLDNVHDNLTEDEEALAAEAMRVLWNERMRVQFKGEPFSEPPGVGATSASDVIRAEVVETGPTHMACTITTVADTSGLPGGLELIQVLVNPRDSHLALVTIKYIWHNKLPPRRWWYQSAAIWVQLTGRRLILLKMVKALTKEDWGYVDDGMASEARGSMRPEL
ncbi:Uu.00g144880.m01.CDS01 [Anthostomella pinea]|uniref:Uu.00g144880.m01.CDS01 n=1 Tax=Anthostomella pinea TaxID=933095 RepID=A0AAI8VS40_9PEZI|nr:Uu.00g144880.m01.CDS01 [Anthostomella pinea]